ncbi:response regulator transcription factor [Magnetospira sp. QH-2]|uniref:response regulator transcription factor n=1 Tax=Magnetospira sp. (strain QH-2) TaxID=1288970 RepID=UPI00208EE855|nr:response regulator transcription factor [Magnetospira sp. QH-2]
MIIEDNKSLATGIAHRFRDHGHAIDLLHDGQEGDTFLSREGADLVILDINLPGMNGMDILRRMRERNDLTPVLMLTARTDISDRVQGLDAGADDYLIKPFEMDELEARVRALCRRRGAARSTAQAIGTLSFDIAARILRSGEEVLDLRRRELAAFECLFERRGRLVPKSLLLDQMYGIGADVDEKVVEVTISRLRKKLAGHRVKIKAARGLGYLMEDADR